jgi:hypothetical protein
MWNLNNLFVFNKRIVTENIYIYIIMIIIIIFNDGIIIIFFNYIELYCFIYFIGNKNN